jgi:hypothetical protein
MSIVGTISACYQLLSTWNLRNGQYQTIEKVITSPANAGAVTVATVITQPVQIESIVVRANANITANLTNLTITSGTGGVITFIDAVTGVRANVAAPDMQVWWTGAVTLPVARIIVITLTGAGAALVDFTVSVKYFSLVQGGLLN